jgi:hypothetical protein
LVLLAATGCALEAHPAGTQLGQGRDIDAPKIVWADGRPLVLFDKMLDDGTDLHAMPFDGQGGESTWGSISTRNTWLTASGTMVAESFPYLSLYSLTSTTPLRGMVGTVDGLQGDELLFHQETPNGRGNSTLVHLPDGQMRELGKLEQHWFSPDGRLYYLQANGIFRSQKATESVVVTADRLASQFVVSADQAHAVIRERVDPAAILPTETRDRLLALPAMREAATLPLENRECSDCAAWLGFSPDSVSFLYAENHHADASLVFQVDVGALEVGKASTRPGPWAMDLLWSPGGDLGLLGERPCAGEGAQCRLIARSLLRLGPTFEPLNTPVVGATFFPSGAHLLFEDALAGGRLLVTRTDALSPDPTAQAVSLSPEGSLLDGRTVDGGSESVVFWARPLGGKSSINLVTSAARSNLYAAKAPDFAVRRLAEAADSVAIGQGYVLALVRFSPQDLTGDLVLFDLRSGHEQTLAAPVSAFWATPDCPTAGSPPLDQQWQGWPTRSTTIDKGCPDSSSLLVAFVVRGRVKSAKDGLWALKVPL